MMLQYLKSQTRINLKNNLKQQQKVPPQTWKEKCHTCYTKQEQTQLYRLGEITDTRDGFPLVQEHGGEEAVFNHSSALQLVILL